MPTLRGELKCDSAVTDLAWGCDLVLKPEAPVGPVIPIASKAQHGIEVYKERQPLLIDNSLNHARDLSWECSHAAQVNVVHWARALAGVKIETRETPV